MKNNTELLISTRRELWTDAISISLGQRTHSGALAAAEPLVFVERPEGSYVEPCLRLEVKDAQKLVDELWNCGLRPSEGSGSAGSLAATERHLKDMQAIAKGALHKHGIET